MSTDTITDPKNTILPLLEGSTWPGAAEAFGAASDMPIPTIRSEAWKYTRVSKLFKESYSAPQGEWAISLPPRPAFEVVRVVFVNGHFRADLSDDLSAATLGKGIVVDSLKNHVSHGPVQKHYGRLATVKQGEDRTANDRLFTAMNTASPTDGLIILVTKDNALQKPLHVLHVITENKVLIQPRDLFLLQEGANAEVLVEVIVDPAEDGGVEGSWINSVREIVIGEGASLSLHLLQNATGVPTMIGLDHAEVSARGLFTIDTTTLEGGLVRNDLSVSLAGPEAHAELNGVYLLNGSTHCDNHTYIGHDVPDCTSDELYKGIISGKGTAVFNGKVYVKQDAQRTRAYQSNSNILNGDDARVYTKPELEIYADDVKCSHGCTIGRLDEHGLFYLRSRGVSEPEARKLMAHAFASDVLERVKNEDWRGHLKGLIDRKLGTL
jgi:Fe-S cluster assembly protein SufD